MPIKSKDNQKAFGMMVRKRSVTQRKVDVHVLKLERKDYWNFYFIYTAIHRNAFEDLILKENDKRWN